MEHKNLFDRMAEINGEIDRMLDGEPNPLEPAVDPHFIELVEEGIAVQKELNILMLGAFHNRPEEHARWEKKLQLCRECDAEGYLEELKARVRNEGTGQ